MSKTHVEDLENNQKILTLFLNSVTTTHTTKRVK